MVRARLPGMASERAIWAGETIGRRSSLPGNWPEEGMLPGRRYAFIAAARRPRVTRPLLPAPGALIRAAGPEESRRRCGRFSQ